VIKQELDIIKQYIVDGVESLLPKDSLIRFLSGNSKMIRSKLGLLYTKCFDNFERNDIYVLLAVTELIHNASLLHDDVIDNALTRRGITTIGNEFSQNISILSGDYLVAIAVNKLLHLHNDKFSALFNNCVQNMAKAEIKQYFFRGKVPSIAEYIEICEGKTASLFIAMLKSVAIVLNISINDAEKLGNLFGIYFQIRNDLDKFSSQVDKKNGIYTVIDILGVEKSSALLDNYKKEVLACLKELPENEYRYELEGLVENYDR